MIAKNLPILHKNFKLLSTSKKIKILYGSYITLGLILPFGFPAYKWKQLGNDVRENNGLKIRYILFSWEY